jgi:hypothetical protein
MNDKEYMQYQLQQVALLTIERILTSKNVPTDEGKLQLISYVVGAATQSIPELEYNQ